jgi:hypothetical protein
LGSRAPGSDQGSRLSALGRGIRPIASLPSLVEDLPVKEEDLQTRRRRGGGGKWIGHSLGQWDDPVRGNPSPGGGRTADTPAAAAPRMNLPRR